MKTEKEIREKVRFLELRGKGLATKRNKNELAGMNTAPEVKALADNKTHLDALLWVLGPKGDNVPGDHEFKELARELGV